MLKIVLNTILAVLAATIVLVLSLQIPTVAENRTELAYQKLGYPLHFVAQDNSRFSTGEPDSPPFPYALNLTNHLNSPITVLAVPLVLNYSILLTLFYLANRIRRSRWVWRGG